MGHKYSILVGSKPIISHDSFNSLEEKGLMITAIEHLSEKHHPSGTGYDIKFVSQLFSCPEAVLFLALSLRVHTVHVSTSGAHVIGSLSSPY